MRLCVSSHRVSARNLRVGSRSVLDASGVERGRAGGVRAWSRTRWSGRSWCATACSSALAITRVRRAARRDHRPGRGGRRARERHALRDPGAVLSLQQAPPVPTPSWPPGSRGGGGHARPVPPGRGRGLEQLREERGVAVEEGLEAEAARRLNAPYLKLLATGRPYVTAKWAMTLDGKTAVASGASRWISGPRSRALVHELRGRMDAILVGIGTPQADDPPLTARPPRPRTPIRLVLDRAARLPHSSQHVRTPRLVTLWGAVTDTRLPSHREAHRLLRLPRCSHSLAQAPCQSPPCSTNSAAGG